MLPTDVVIAHDGKRRRRAAADREDAHREPERLLRRRNLQPAIHGARISGRSVQPPAISQAMSSARRRCPVGGYCYESHITTPRRRPMCRRPYVAIGIHDVSTKRSRAPAAPASSAARRRRAQRVHTMRGPTRASAEQCSTTRFAAQSLRGRSAGR
jgi:hypothetical protein